MTDTDYRNLLKKYINHVVEQEGISFISGYPESYAPGEFTVSEWKALRSAEEEVFANND